MYPMASSSQEEDEDDGNGHPYLHEDSPGALEIGSYSDDTSSSDEEPYYRKMLHSFEFNGCTGSAFRSNLASSSELETDHFQKQTSALADADAVDCLSCPVLGTAQVFAWERAS